MIEKKGILRGTCIFASELKKLKTIFFSLSLVLGIDFKNINIKINDTHPPLCGTSALYYNVKMCSAS